MERTKRNSTPLNASKPQATETAACKGLLVRALMGATAFGSGLVGLELDGFDRKAHANPTGGAVVGGSATITSPTNNNMVIKQTSDRAIIHWNDFSIGKGELVQFLQPGSNSAVLNRVVSNIPSSILGSLKANGRVFLLNPNGIMIGAGAVIDTGGFVGSTLQVSDEDFMNKRDLLFQGESKAQIINHGKIFSKNGDIYLMAREIKNTGTGKIISKNGEVTLGAGKEVFLAEKGRDRMSVKVGFTRSKGQPATGVGIENDGTIEATRVKLQAANGNIYGLAIKNSGTIKATGLTKTSDGRIMLMADGGRIRAGGKLQARHKNGKGGRIDLHAGATGTVEVSGTLDVSGRRGQKTTGGKVRVSGRTIRIEPAAHIDASGDFGGGSIRLGGSRRGAPLQEGDSQPVTIPPARPEHLQVDEGAALVADAREEGNGGEVILWSDKDTIFKGDISAKGGAKGGDGGFAEISGKENLFVTSYADLTAVKGQAGELLLDPGSISIVDGGTGFTNWNVVNDGYLSAQLELADVTVATANATNGGAGDITLQAAASIDWTADTTLTFDASRDVILQGDINNTGSGGFEITAGRDITVTNSADLRWNAPDGVNVTPAGGTDLWRAGRDIVFDGRLNAMAGGTLHMNATGDITFGTNTVLSMKHTYDPVGNSTSQTGYGNLRLNAGGMVTTAGTMRDIGAVTITANELLLNADMWNGGGHHGITSLQATVTNNITVNRRIMAVGGTNSVTLTSNTGDIIINDDLQSARNLRLTAVNGMVQVNAGTTRMNSNNGGDALHVTARTLQVNAPGRLYSRANMRLQADDYQINGQLYMANDGRWIYLDSLSNNSHLCLGDIACGSATSGPMIHLTQAELDFMNRGHLYTGYAGRVDLTEVSSAVNLGNRVTQIRTDDIEVNAALNQTGTMRFYSNGGDIYLGDGGTAAFHMTQAEIANLDANSWMQWYSWGGDITVDEISFDPAKSQFVRLDAGAGNMTFRNSAGDGDPSLSVGRYLYAYADQITVENGGAVDVGTTGAGRAYFYTQDGLTLNDNVTAHGPSSHIILHGDRNADGVGGVDFGANVAVTVPDRNSSITIYTPQMANLHSAGADGLYLNNGTLSILPTIPIAPNDIMVMGLGDVVNCQANFCARSDVHLFAIDKTEHLDHFYDVGTANFGSDKVDVLVLGDLDYRTLVSGNPGDRLYLTGNDIRFDEEFNLSNVNILEKTNASHIDYLRPMGGFDAADVTITNPSRFDLPTGTDLHISPASGKQANGQVAAATVDAYFGDKASAPTSGLVITNDFLNVFSGRNLVLGSDLRTSVPYRAATSTVNGLDVRTSFTGNITVAGDKVRVESGGVISNRGVTLHALRNYANDALVVNGTVTAQNGRINANAYNYFGGLNRTVGGIAYRNRKGGTVTITENGRLVNSNNNGDIVIRGRAVNIESTADPVANAAISTNRTAHIQFFDRYSGVNAYFGTAGTTGGNRSYFTENQLARIDINNGGNLVFAGENPTIANHHRTYTNYYFDGFDGDTAFANVDGQIQFTATARPNSGDGNGVIRFTGAASDLGQHDYHFWGQNGIQVNADVSVADGHNLYLEAGYNRHANQQLKIAGITGTGLIDASYLRMEAVGAGIGTAANAVRTRAGSLWVSNNSDRYHNGPVRTGGIYIQNESATGLSLNRAFNDGGTGDIAIRQTGGGALYVANDDLDYGARNRWGLTTSGVTSSSDEYQSGGVRWSAPGDIQLDSDDGIVVLNKVAVVDPGADSVNQIDASYDGHGDNVHMLNGSTGSNLISVDERVASWAPAGYSRPTITLNGGTDLRLDRGLSLGATDRLHIGGARNVTVAAPITSAASGPVPGFSIVADNDVILGTNGDLTTTAADGVITVTAVNGSIQMSDDAVTTTTGGAATDPLASDGTHVATGDRLGTLTVTANGYSVGIDTVTPKGTELRAGTVLRRGTVLRAGTVLPMTVNIQGVGNVAAGTVLAVDRVVNQDVALSADVRLSADMTLAAGSMVAENSVFRSAEIAATGLNGAVQLHAGTDIALGRVSVVDGSITARAATGGVSGAITDALAAEMADASDQAFLADPTRTDNANLLTEGGDVFLSGKRVGTKTADGSGFIDIHSRNNGDVKIIDPLDPDPANPTLAGAWGSDAGDGAYVSILNSGTVGNFDMVAQAGIGLMQGVGDLNWGAGSDATSLGGGDILLITKGLNGSSGNITFTGDLDATNTVTGLTGDVVLRAEDNVLSAGGKVIGDRLVVTATNGTVGGSAATPLRTDVQSIAFGSQNGVWIQDEGTDLTKTVSLTSIDPVLGIASRGDVVVTAEANLAIANVSMTDGDLTLTSRQGDIVQGAGPGLSTNSTGPGPFTVSLDAAGSIGSTGTALDVDLNGDYRLQARSRGNDLAAGDGSYLRSLNDFANGIPVAVTSDGHATLAGVNNLTWDGSMAVTTAANGTLTLRADGVAAGSGDVILQNTLAPTVGKLSLEAARNIGASAAGVQAIASNLSLDAGNAIHLDVNADRLSFSAGAGGALIREADSVTVSGSTRGGSGGDVTVIANGDLFVSDVTGTAAVGDGEGFIYADQGGSLSLTSTNGNILLDGRVASVQGAAAGVAYSHGDLATPAHVGTGAITLNAQGTIEDRSVADVGAADTKASTALNVVSDGAVSLNAGRSIGRDLDDNPLNGFTDTLDVHAGVLSGFAGGTGFGDGLYVTLAGSASSANLGALSSNRNIGIEAARNLTLNSAVTAPANGYLALQARQDLTIAGGASLSGGGQTLLSAGNDLTMTGGTITSTGTGSVTLRAVNDLAIQGGTVTHTGGVGQSGMMTALDGSPIPLDRTGIVLDANNITIDTATVSTNDGSGIMAVASQDLTLQNANITTTGSGRLSLVADHRSTANNGGRLTIDALSNISSAIGAVGLFAHDIESFKIDGDINGVGFTQSGGLYDHYFGVATGDWSGAGYKLFFEKAIVVPVGPAAPILPGPPDEIYKRIDIPKLEDTQLSGNVRVRERMPHENENHTTLQNGSQQQDGLQQKESYGIYFKRKGKTEKRGRLLSIDSFEMNPDREFISSSPRYYDPDPGQESNGR